ncbi:MAG: LiaF transmembrane domain-containing protein [Suipraeoptans sp.]
MRKRERVFWGIFLIIAAALVIVSKLGVLQGISIFSIVVGVLLVGCAIQSIISKSVSGLLFAVAFLIILFDKPLGLQAITPWPVLLAAMLGSIGLSVLFPKHSRPFRGKNWKVEYDNEYDENIYDENEFIHESKSNGGKYREYSTVFGGGTKYINTEDFKGVKLQSVFGGMKVYFDNAHIQGDSAVIKLEVVFGNMELFLPKEWNIIMDTTCVCSGIQEKNRPSGDINGPTVRLTGEVVFGGATILYV